MVACRDLPAALRVVSRCIQSYVAFNSLLEAFVSEFALTNRYAGSVGMPLTNSSVVKKINHYGLCLISRFLKGISARDVDFQSACLQKESAVFGQVRARILHLAQPDVHQVGCQPDPRFKVPLLAAEMGTELSVVEVGESREESADTLSAGQMGTEREDVGEPAHVFRSDPRNIVELLLRSYVHDVYWYTMGTQGYEIGFPCKPANVLGTLRIRTADGSRLRWFYYKDNKPNHYGWQGQTHSEWCYLVGDDLGQLLAQMRHEDVIAFARAVYSRQTDQKTDDAHSSQSLIQQGIQALRRCPCLDR